MAKILIVEDDKDVAGMIGRKLSFDRHVCDVVHNGTDALHLAKSSTYDLLILDWQLPDVSGPEICRDLRGRGFKGRVIFLTGKGELSDKEEGYESGGDDYLTKPFHIKELELRVQALLKRPIEVRSPELICGALRMDSDAHTVFACDIQLDLSIKEFSLLELFMQNQDVVFSPEEIISRLWSTESEVTPGAVRTLIKQLRRKLSDENPDAYIRNVYGMGYKMPPAV